MEDKIKYSLDGIKRGIQAARTNIKTFEGAIEKEKRLIKDLQKMETEIKRKDEERKIISMAKDMNNDDKD